MILLAQESKRKFSKSIQQPTVINDGNTQVKSLRLKL